MIDFFFGKPRTGKSYRAVKVIYDDYIKEDASPKYTNILTNVGGFKFKEVNEIFLFKGSKSVVYKLVWKNFYEHLSVMYKMALDDKDDEELNRYAYYHKINDSLIVLDEAALYMKKYDDVISWFLAYHGHFKIRIIIIAQGPKQINGDYLVHAEIYYEAQPQSKQLASNKLRYIHYSDVYFSKDNKFSSDTITTNQDIFDLYKSGEVDKPPKKLYKFIFLMVLAFVFMIGIFKFLMYRLSPGEEVINSQSLPTHTNDNYQNNQIYSDSLFLTLRCDNRTCWNIDDKYEDNQISLSYFKFIVLKYELELLFNEVNVEISKNILLDYGTQKITLADFTDYYYRIPKSIKNDELYELFIPREEEQYKNDGFKLNPFNTEVESKTDVRTNA